MPQNSQNVVNFVNEQIIAGLFLRIEYKIMLRPKKWTNLKNLKNLKTSYIKLSLQIGQIYWIDSTRQDNGESPSQQNPSPVRQSSIFGALTKPKVSNEGQGVVGGVEEEGQPPSPS